MDSEGVLAMLDGLDLTLPHAVVSVVAACAALWTMQCVTIHAGVANWHRRGMLLLRAGLVLLSFCLMVSGAMPAWRQVPPWPEAFALACCILLVLIATPIAIGGRRGADHIAGAGARDAPA